VLLNTSCSSALVPLAAAIDSALMCAVYAHVAEGARAPEFTAAHTLCVRERERERERERVSECVCVAGGACTPDCTAAHALCVFVCVFVCLYVCVCVRVCV